MTGKFDNSETATGARPIAGIRERRSRVHCIVNEAAISVTANVLLAAGAVPSMSHDPQEVVGFTKSSDALSVNLGMLTASKRDAINTAVGTACDNGIPWVLDPALANRSESRLKFCETLLERRPRVIRGNAAEIDSLCNAMKLTRQDLARNRSIVVMTTGEGDQIISRKHIQELDFGHAWMESVTGMGCALSALLAAFLTVIDDAFEAAVEIAQLYGSIGRAAATRSGGPGTFLGHFLDGLYAESVL